MDPALEASVFEELLASLREPATVATLYRKFAANAAAMIGELAAQDGEARGQTLHTLKGSAAMMGATRLSTLSAVLEAQAHWSAVQVAAATEELDAELRMLRAAVAARLLEIGAPFDC
jgi:HPt (histidine-containing phosphotransfer) domain-containing protein